MKRLAMVTVLVTLWSISAYAQTPGAATMKQLMLDLIHPASNDVLLAIFRSAPDSDAWWATVRRNGLTLQEAGTVLASRGRPGDEAWASDARRLFEVGGSLYRAAVAKDFSVLSTLAQPLDDSCTTCHRHFRPNVFPLEGRPR